MLLLFFVIWIIFIGNITPETLLFGAGVSIVIFAFICFFSDHSLKKELSLYAKIPLVLKHIFILIAEIIKANLAVMTLILSGPREPKAEIVEFDCDMGSETRQILLANSITLTPGTITVSLDEKTYRVHALTPELAEGLDDSVFVHELKKEAADE